jgi:geranylgeranyl reductase family protein
VIRCDAVVVGGGPAGSTCARTLRLAGWNVVVLDRARFPRDKVCAGWLTPGVFTALELDPETYRSTGLVLQDIRGFRTGVIGRHLLDTDYGRVVSYAVRRCEFDDFLLRRAAVEVVDGTPLARLERRGDVWILNEAITAPVLIGAGGHFCPVARFLQGRADSRQPVVAKEAECRVEGELAVSGERPELLFCRDLDGYAWCVRKGNYVNVGIGRRTPIDFARHVREFVALLEASGINVDASDMTWRGHAYFATGVGSRPIVADGVLIAGDAAGLAYPESGEGICPAIESGRLAAETVIDADGRYDAASLNSYGRELRRKHPAVQPATGSLRKLTAAAGRMLLGSQAFTRHILLDRWFLRTGV